MSDTADQEGFFSRWGRRLTKARNFALNTAFVLFILVLVGTLFSQPDMPSVEQDSALFIAPSGTLVEEITPPSSWRDVVFNTRDAGLIAVKDLMKSIDLAAEDERITLLVLNFDELGGLSPSRAIAIGERLAAFRGTGKQVLAYTEYSGQSQYLASSYADEIYLHPMGSVLLTGLGSDRLYFADLLEKLKITMHVFRVGEYKSAVEPYSRNNMSDAARKDSKRLLDGIWQNMTTAIADNRDIDPDIVAQYANSFDQLLQDAGGDIARATLDSQLVDGLLTKNAFRDKVGEIVGWQENALRGIGFQSYLAVHSDPIAVDPIEDSLIGVLTVQGGIVEFGPTRVDVANAEVLVDQIRMAKEDEQIKALVMRVDSPGGSAFASELIREELSAFQASGKPLVASFGPVAASGGYWISADADAIYAEPTTITGSIGIFGLVPNFSRSLDAIGINADGVSSAPLARGLSVVGDLSEQAKRILQLSVEHGYGEFIDLVANGRDMSKESVEAIAQGRVWSGAAALEIGLVDELGNLEDAVAHAAELAELADWSTVDVRPPLDAQSVIMMQLMNTSVSATAPEPSWLSQWVDHLPWVHEAKDSLSMLSVFSDPRHVYAMCVSCKAQ
ncbi:MAG: signal peptide peptidase SppA [Pseudomonadota bacterium]|nr:signal peptide peptidase SppA [Pseudomonadota bacterium]